MKFAIELEPNYTIIAPEVDVMDKEFAEALFAKIKEGLEANANQNFIIDLGVVQQMVNDSVHPLLCIQEAVEATEGNLVFTNVQELVLQKIKQERLHLSLQLANTMEEAITLVNNDEKMARGLLNEM
ncbi:MAG: hypothetical protein BGO31_06340 [Bacteroidetes bacterium 43-16]|nr:MAG: hypothetical protein BGO31_06340 [Bacteroidetes bacterium 43-16]